MFIFWSIILAVAALVGLYIGVLELRDNSPASAAAPSGWVYFLSPFGGAAQEPPAPIKIGMTHRDPYEERLPEIETMSPQPLEIIASIPSKDPARLEKMIHEHLKPFRLHGEWFERDVTLAFIDQFIN